MNEGDTMSDTERSKTYRVETTQRQETIRKLSEAPTYPYGLTGDAGDVERLRQQLRGVVETLERIRDHANSGDDPALLAQHELDRLKVP